MYRVIKKKKALKVQTYGYARVSTVGQNLDRQVDELREVGISSKNIYCDKQSGKDFERNSYKRLLKKLKKGDLLIIKSLDRLGRNYEEIIVEWRRITKEIKAHIRVLDMPLLDTSQYKGLIGTFISDLVLQILSFVAQQNLDYIHQTQQEGIIKAKEKGIKFGRPRIEVDENFYLIHARWLNKELSANQAAEILGMSRRTFYRRAEEMRT